MPVLHQAMALHSIFISSRAKAFLPTRPQPVYSFIFSTPGLTSLRRGKFFFLSARVREICLFRHSLFAAWPFVLLGGGGSPITTYVIRMPPSFVCVCVCVCVMCIFEVCEH